MPINDIFICLDVVLKGEIPFLRGKRENCVYSRNINYIKILMFSEWQKYAL